MAEAQSITLGPRAENLAGKRFGRWTVLSFAGKQGTNPVWSCKCDCGAVAQVSRPNLTTGASRSCGCAKKTKPVTELTGMRFGRLVVIAFAGRREIGPKKQRHTVWKCVCDCGTVVDVRAGELNNGGTRSCGCLVSDTSRENATIHGGCGTAEYNSWRAMRERCDNPKCKHYRYYGGRGISICQRWLESFANFLADMGTKPSPKHSIDRIDPNGNYEPSNCRWATPTEQARNQRRHKICA